MKADSRCPDVAALVLLVCTLGSVPVHAQLSQNMQDWMRRINAGEYDGGVRGGRGGVGAQWLEGGKAYRLTEPVRIDTSSGTTAPLPAEPS